MTGKNQDYFKIESNNAIPSRGKILISEPFLRDSVFGRSVVLLIDHTKEGTMGLIMNKLLPMKLNEVVKEFKYLEDIPLYNGGPMGTDTLFYLHTLKDIEGALAIGSGLYLNGNFNEIKRYILQGNPIEGNIRFFLGYSGWQDGQLNQEIEENTWMIGKGEAPSLMLDEIKSMWKKALGKLGGKYETWSHFPINPSLN
ncbi:putative transcriptional regulator [Bacteroides luti]|uniref:Putative transcriptional regulator n=1 Tax=Bacteroides luti TaxID=1297750 RepID=A0A1M5BIK0_9BACE|nr:YqgE/AlgH family protein [Bacteroides luti]SHF42229.1 putative transcriptional regulator [Bacteroides luti]